ncbi:MAG TPA: antibiotic biosynthesis monooxygenase [Candidatus Dormibacteraeota bacterium]
MHCRVIRLKGTPDKADEALKLWTSGVLPALKKQHGFAGATLLGNRRTGDAYTVTYWETEKAMKEAREHVRPEAVKALGITGGNIVEEDDCEVAVLERFKPAKVGAWLRLNSATTEAAHVSEAISFFKTKIVPTIEKQPGARTAFSFVNRQTGRTFTGSAWDTEKDLQNSAAVAAGVRDEATKKFALQGAKVETFEILFTEILTPAATSR